MQALIELIRENAAWLFSGLGVAVLTGVIKLIWRKRKRFGHTTHSGDGSHTIIGNNNVIGNEKKKSR